jgi:hypothetical protein
MSLVQAEDIKCPHCRTVTLGVSFLRTMTEEFVEGVIIGPLYFVRRGWWTLKFFKVGFKGIRKNEEPVLVALRKCSSCLR